MALVTHTHMWDSGARTLQPVCVREEGQAVNSRARTSTRGLPIRLSPTFLAPETAFMEDNGSCPATVSFQGPTCGVVPIQGSEGCSPGLDGS